MSDRQVLIGGVPGAGKSTLAKALSEQWQTPWISTDQIRDILGITPLIPESRNIESAKQKAEEVWIGVERLIQNYHPWEGWIIEGSAILPHLVDRLDHKPITIFLLEENKDSIVEVLRERSRLPWINTKTGEQIETKAEHLLELNEFLKQEANKYGFPTIITPRTADTVERVFALIGQ